MPPGLKTLKNGGGGVVWNPKWASDARHMVVAGPVQNLGADRADIWLGQFADDFNSIAKWVQVTDNEYMDNYAYVWVDPGKQSGRALKGKVGEADHVAPELLSAVALDDRRVLLTCSEPVRGAAARVTRESGAAATKLGIDGERRGIFAEFAEPLAAKETLTVTGVTDCAQPPNKMAAAKAQIVRPDWPSNLAGLCYLWKNARTRNVIFDERLGLPVVTALDGDQRARFNREGAAMAAGGAFAPSRGSAERILEGIRKTRQFSFEIVVASADLTQTKGNDDKPLGIVNWCLGWGNGIFWLLQEKDKLLVGLSRQGGDPKPEVFEMATLPDTKPHHLIVSVAAKRLAFYLDGRKVKEIDPSPASIIAVKPPPIRFAAHGPDMHKNIWRGTFEYVAMYSRFIEEDEAAKNAAVVAADLAKRKPMDRVVVDARLVAKTLAPEPKDMMPYRSALVVYEYAVQKVKDGKAIKDGQVVRVVHWGVRDLKNTPAAKRAVGATVQLTLERFADHPELEAQFMRDDLPVSEADLWTDDQP
jgi:hypothetical protein